MDNKKRTPIDSGSRVKGHLLVLCVKILVFTIQTTVLVQSLSNFTCKSWMMRRGTLLILGHGIKGQGHLLFGTRVKILVFTIQTTGLVRSLSNFTCKLWMMRRETVLILGHGVKGQGHLRYSVYEKLWA